MNERKLKAVMQLHGESQQDLAQYLQMSLSRLNAKINEYRGAQFRQNEIAAIWSICFTSRGKAHEGREEGGGRNKKALHACGRGGQRLQRTGAVLTQQRK